MQRSTLIGLILFSIIFPIIILSEMLETKNTDEAAGDSSTSQIEESDYSKIATQFVNHVSNKKYEDAYKMGGSTLQEIRNLEQFKADMVEAGLDKEGTITRKAKQSPPRNAGLKLMGTFAYSDGKTSVPVYFNSTK